jgi:sugar/nucleoside kinase (ribokinase family)
MTNERRKGIACGGVWIVDIVKVVDFYPTENSLANILSESMGGGGCGYNVAIDLAKFDPALELYASGLIGNDPYGDFLVEQCRKFPNINLGELRRTEVVRTSYTDVFNVKNTARRTYFHYQGANRLFGPESVDLDNLPVELFHLGYLLLMDHMDEPDAQYGTVAARFLAELQTRGITTSIDLVSEDSHRFSRVVPPALKYTDYCIINDFEAERLCGIPFRDEGKVIEANLRNIAAAIFKLGVSKLVVIHFPEGAYLLTKDGAEMVQPSLSLPQEFIVGSAGAGDSFCAGVLYGLYKGWDYAKILQFAVCAGGMNLSDLTTTGSIGPCAEVLKMQERFSFREAIA